MDHRAMPRPALHRHRPGHIAEQAGLALHFAGIDVRRAGESGGVDHHAVGEPALAVMLPAERHALRLELGGDMRADIAVAEQGDHHHTTSAARS